MMCLNKRHTNRYMRETLHLTSISANRKRLEEAVAEMNSGNFLKNDLIESNEEQFDFGFEY